MKFRSWRAVMALSFFSHYYVGFSMELSRVSPNPMKAYKGSNVVFKWTLAKEITSRPHFEKLVFGVWRNGYLDTYITTVTKTGRIIPNPELLQQESQFHGRVQWKGDLSQSVAAFEISNIDSRDQMDYGLVLKFGLFRDQLSNVISLAVKERGSSIKALSSQEALRSGENASLLCDFYVHDKDKPVFQGVILGLCARGGISLTLVSLTKEDRLIVNPDLDQEGPDYLYRTEATQQGLNKTSNTTRVSLVLRNVTVAEDGVYGCFMDFGPFREPIASLVDIEVKGSSSSQGPTVGNNLIQKVRVSTTTEIRCPVLYEVIQMEGTFEGLLWSYCRSKNCSEPETRWTWLAGMAQQGAIKVTETGSYAKRVNLTRNGTLEVNQVRPEDATDYRCTVKRINYTSPRNYFVSLVVDTTALPYITNKSKSQVTVIEGNTLYLACEVEGNPQPVVSWEKDGNLLQNSTKNTNYIRHHIKKDDTGRYKCKATNSVGSDSYAVDVTVKGQEANSKHLTKLSLAMIVVAVCCLVFLGGAGLFCYCLIRRRKKRQYDAINNVATL